MSVFAGYARYYDLLYQDKNYAEETRYVVSSLEQYAPGVRTLLELGCGTGAYTECFLKAGIAVDGLDLSPEMIRCASTRLTALPGPLRDAARVMVGDAREVALGKTYDAVVALFHVLSYQRSNQDVRAFLQAAAAHLEPGGVALFDFWYGPAVLSERPSVRVKRCAGPSLRLMRVAEPVMKTTENLVEVNYELVVKDLTAGTTEILAEQHVMRYFFLPELEDFLAAAGLKLVSARQWLADTAPAEQSWNVCVIARK